MHSGYSHSVRISHEMVPLKSIQGNTLLSIGCTLISQESVNMPAKKTEQTPTKYKAYFLQN